MIPVKRGKLETSAYFSPVLLSPVQIRDISPPDVVDVSAPKPRKTKKNGKAKQKQVDEDFLGLCINTPDDPMPDPFKKAPDNEELPEKIDRFPNHPDFRASQFQDFVNVYAGGGLGKSPNALREEIIRDAEKRIRVVATEEDAIDESEFEAFFLNDEIDETTIEMYKDMGMESMIHEREEYLAAAVNSFKMHAPMNLRAAALECCDVTYCADYLREARGEGYGERACKNGQKCVLYVLATNYPDQVTNSVPDDAFVGREFLLPSQEEEYKRTGNLPPGRRTCLACNRFKTTNEHYWLIKTGRETEKHLHDHYNKVCADSLTEDWSAYPIGRCIYPSTTGKWNGISRPIVKFSANTLTYTRREMEVDHKTHARGLVKCVVENNTNFH